MTLGNLVVIDTCIKGYANMLTHIATEDRVEFLTVRGGGDLSRFVTFTDRTTNVNSFDRVLVITTGPHVRPDFLDTSIWTQLLTSSGVLDIVCLHRPLYPGDSMFATFLRQCCCTDITVQYSTTSTWALSTGPDQTPCSVFDLYFQGTEDLCPGYEQVGNGRVQSACIQILSQILSVCVPMLINLECSIQAAFPIYK